MNENIILKYRREFDCWVCDECDIENSNAQDVCIICNTPRPPYPTILKAWSPADEVPTPPPPQPKPAPVKRKPPVSPAPVFRDESRGRYEPPKSSDGMSSLLIWLLVFIVIFAALIVYSIYGA